MVRCRAHVETIRPATPFRPGSYEVHVLGEEPHDYVRIYRIEHRSEDGAAQQGLDRFVEQVSNMVERDR